ncbi:MAG: cysteine--tRNA ligase [Gammaproteobacteria bacterium]|nr:cysteine--tRNA ligase [Gammaproteobacteria bacterium]
MLHIYNSLTGKKEKFVPIVPGKVGMYVCGMTVYDYCHIGHARVLVAFDVVARYLRHSGYDLTYVRNVTDIDDKIIKRANENGEPFETLTHRFIEAMHEDAALLGVLPPDQEPKATASMDDIIAMIQTLVDKGAAYCADNGDVYYDISRFENYGQLSGKKLEDLRAGARVDVDEAKDDPLDFVLWKSAKPNEPAWDAPWGRGRPGWHIECSAMAKRCLGDHFDIHGGGMDLKFPHHENEIAQSESASGHHYVNVWMHNGFVNIDNEKMSKSLGNFFTIRDVLARYQPEVVRYFILTSQYRSPLSYSDEHLDNAKFALDRFYLALRDLPASKFETGSEYEQRFHNAMNDDFNTPEALAVLFDVVREINSLRESNTKKAAQLAALLRHLGAIMGLLQENSDHYFKGDEAADGVDSAAIEALIEKRKVARQNKDWAESDRVRDELQSQGIIIEDGSGGTSWRRQ